MSRSTEHTEPAPCSSKDGLCPPTIQVAPCPQCGARQRRWQGIPGIERADKGRLWAMWYSGTDGEGPGNFVVLVTSGDDAYYDGRADDTIAWPGTAHLAGDVRRAGATAPRGA